MSNSKKDAAPEAVKSYRITARCRGALVAAFIEAKDADSAVFEAIHSGRLGFEVVSVTEESAPKAAEHVTAFRPANAAQMWTEPVR